MKTKEQTKEARQPKPDERKHADQVVEFLQRLTRSASLFRVTYGMATLVDPRNELIDQDSDVLELHPKFSKVAQQRDELLAALDEAATSLETLSILSGRKTYGSPPIETFMDDFMQVRGYAESRATVARAAIAKAKGE